MYNKCTILNSLCSKILKNLIEIKGHMPSKYFLLPLLLNIIQKDNYKHFILLF